MFKTYLGGGLAAAMLCACPAAAQDGNGGSTVMVGVTGGTLGVGPEAGFRFSDTFGVRANATFLNIGAEFDSDDIAYDGDLKLKSFGAMLDVYPFGGNFRISGGARINRNRVEVVATPSAGASFGDGDYSAAEIGTLTGEANVKRFAPALTIGWAARNRPGFMFGADLGVLFQGAARLSEFRSNGSLANDPDFQADLEAERQSLQDDIDKVKVYPILQLTLGYRF